MADYANIREILGFAVGKRIVDVTQHDEEEWKESRACYVELLLEGGGTIRFNVGDEGFVYRDPDEPDDDDEADSD